MSAIESIEKIWGKQIFLKMFVILFSHAQNTSSSDSREASQWAFELPLTKVRVRQSYFTDKEPNS